MSLSNVQVEVIDAEMTFSGMTVFKGLNAVFPAARVTALVGPSGSGKSTLLAAISGYLQLKKGRVQLCVDGEPPSPPDPSRVAWVPQGSNALGRRSVLDNVIIGALGSGSSLADARAIAEEALALVGLSEVSGSPARKLSGGELQRTALARALASGKELILADEPSANLDTANTERLSEILRGLTLRSTIVVATHDPILVAAAEATVRMRSESAIAT